MLYSVLIDPQHDKPTLSVKITFPKNITWKVKMALNLGISER